jgi:diguanylate cyclase (GGDEF)-like protein
MSFSLLDFIKGTGAHAEPQRTLPNLFYIFTFIFLVLVGCVNALVHEMFYAWLLLGLAIVSLIIFWAGKYTRKYDFTDGITLVVLCAFGVHLLASGGVANNGHLWMFVLPGMVMFAFGLRKGVICVIFLFVMACLMFFGPLHGLLKTTYPLSFMIRFPIAFLGTGAFCGLVEYSRKCTFNRLVTLTEELDRSARTDALTGLFNRRGMTERMEYEHHRWMRSGEEYSLVLCDIDHFKEINDKYGHECGDKVLVHLAGILLQILRKQDIAARWGGEEFLLLLPGTKHDGALAVAEKIREAIAHSHYLYKDQVVLLTASFGIQTAMHDDFHDDVRIADERLYKAKHNGRNCIIGS